jgi:hypothetical protein
LKPINLIAFFRGLDGPQKAGKSQDREFAKGRLAVFFVLMVS